MRFIEEISKWGLGNWVFFLYVVIGILFFLYLCYKIQRKTDDLEEQVYLQYCAVIWCSLWPIMFLKDVVFRRR